MTVDAIPSWAVFIGVIAFVMLAIEGGYRLGCSAHRRSEEEKESPVSAIAGSVLGLGAFVLAFTFALVANRFDARKELVMDEANAVRTAWLRSDFLPETDRAEAKAIIRRYLDSRIAFVQSREADPERVASRLAEAEANLGRLWDVAVANARKDMNSDVAALYIESLNDVYSIHASRVAKGLQMRIPLGIWCVLLVVTCLGMMAVGYQTGIAGSKRSLARPILAVSFALVIAMIAELDRPHGRFIHVSQQALSDLQSQISGVSEN
jgi:hypothetical protein